MNDFNDAIPVLATVNYESIAGWYGRDDARDVLRVMLGCAMAHELSHLLLRDPGHSTIGITQPQWGDDSIREALTPHLAMQQLLQPCCSSTRGCF